MRPIPTGTLKLSVLACALAKLYEELLIDAESQPTAHPLIYRAQEQSLPPHELWPQLDALKTAIAAQDVAAALKLLSELVPEWRRAKTRCKPGRMTGSPLI